MFPQAFTLALPLLAPKGTLIFKVFLSPLDPQGSIMISQLEPFFAIPQADQKPDVDVAGLLSVDEAMAQRFKQGDCDVDGYDAYGRRGGVWVRKPRSSRPGSAG
jgi:tRNA (cytidine32/guanosine34-2'-O)-methyltransferase